MSANHKSNELLLLKCVMYIYFTGLDITYRCNTFCPLTLGPSNIVVLFKKTQKYCRCHNNNTRETISADVSFLLSPSKQLAGQLTYYFVPHIIRR